MKEQLLQELVELRDQVVAFEKQHGEILPSVHEGYRASAANLLHYLSLRQHDIRPLQEQLAILGLSSLGRAESHVFVNLETVCKALHDLARVAYPPQLTQASSVGLVEGHGLLQKHAESLLGPEPPMRDVRIMVTMATEAGDDPALVRQLVDSGMNCLRINCAHDDVRVWSQMIVNLKLACQAAARDCKILMDLAGPKLRTGPLEKVSKVVKWRPQRDDRGRMLQPARIWLTPAEASEAAPEPANALLRMPQAWLETLVAGDTVRFVDARGAKRKILITESRGDNRWGECAQTCYVSEETVFFKENTGTGWTPMSTLGAATATLPKVAKPILLKKGDRLFLTKNLTPGRDASRADDGTVLVPAIIGITLPEIFAAVQPGEPIWFDDGKIGGTVIDVEADRITVEITQARPKGEKLRADKGINLPESKLNLPALTDEDIANLSFVASNADIVGYSFVQCEEDLTQLQSKLKELGRQDIGIILKIETKRAFENLPELIFAAMRSPRIGIMIARGDLAVECGYERLAEVQEEILWLCEAAHVPVIWATQVLESLAKTGTPSRAEVTDAAMSERAECVMLNKGPHIVEAVQLLDGVLRRMGAHQNKKSPMLRPLRLAERFPRSAGRPG